MFRSEKYKLADLVARSQWSRSCGIVWINSPKLEFQGRKLFLCIDSNFTNDSQFNLFAVRKRIELQIPSNPRSLPKGENHGGISSMHPENLSRLRLLEIKMISLPREKTIRCRYFCEFCSSIASLNIRNHLHRRG